MNTVLLISRISRQLVLQALAMAAIVAASAFLLFRYHYHVRLPLSFWLATTTFNFVVFVAMLSFMRWLQQKREEWRSGTNLWFGAVMLLLAVLLFIAAFYIGAS